MFLARKGSILLIFSFIAYIVILGLWGIVSPDRKMSEFENRALSQRPSFSWQKLWDGRYTQQWEQYIVDQFAGRDQWVALKAVLERGSGKMENHDIFFGQQDYLFERLSPPGTQFTRNLEELKRFAQSRQAAREQVYAMFIPQSQAVYSEYMPPYALATTADSKQLIDYAGGYLADYATYVPVTETLIRNKDKSVYFRTDHHWNTQGAYLGYREFALAAGLTPMEDYDLMREVAANTFFGTYYTKANDRSIQPDQFSITRPNQLPTYEVCTSDGEPCRNDIHVLSALNERDKYKVFFNGNPAWVRITTQANTGKRIAVFKDSFANVMMPYLIRHYDAIHMIDMRYFNMRVDEYLKEHPVDDVLLLYGVKTIMEDDIFKWMNRSG